MTWANQGSMEFGREIAQSARWATQRAWGSLSKQQHSRAVRLFSVLKSAFQTHGRIALLIQGFSEGLGIVAVALHGDVLGNATTYMGNGFELLRQLVKEFSLRSKSSRPSGITHAKGVSCKFGIWCTCSRHSEANRKSCSYIFAFGVNFGE